MLAEISVWVPNKPGQLVKVLDTLNMVNIQAFNIEDAGQFSIIRLVMDDPNLAAYHLDDAFKSEYQIEIGQLIAVELAHKPAQLSSVT